MKYWFAYVAALYAVWLVLAFGFGYWRQAKAHWPMAAVMTFGSVVAGSTPMGGGTVAFPFLVLVFGQSPALGRNDLSHDLHPLPPHSRSIAPAALEPVGIGRWNGDRHVLGCAAAAQ
jgi:hypothetical protein